MTQAATVYRVRSQEIWDLARDDYLAGKPARIVCRRYDLGLSAFRIRARKGEWRRGDPVSYTHLTLPTIYSG